MVSVKFSLKRVLNFSTIKFLLEKDNPTLGYKVSIEKKMTASLPEVSMSMLLVSSVIPYLSLLIPTFYSKANFIDVAA